MTLMNTATAKSYSRGVTLADYHYDALGRRIRKIIPTGQPDAGNWTYVVNELWQVVSEYKTVSSTTTHMRRYVHAGAGNTIGAGLSSVRSNAPYVDDHIAMWTFFGNYQNRHREYSSFFGRYAQRGLLGYQGDVGLSPPANANPLTHASSSSLAGIMDEVLAMHPNIEPENSVPWNPPNTQHIVQVCGCTGCTTLQGTGTSQNFPLGRAQK